MTHPEVEPDTAPPVPADAQSDPDPDQTSER